MSDALFLPQGQVWLGFDETGRSIAASIEKRKPTRGKSVMEGCVEVVLCRIPKGETCFGLQRSDVEEIRHDR